MNSEIPFPLPEAEIGKILSRLLGILSDPDTRLPLTDNQMKYIVRGLHPSHGHGAQLG